MDQIQTPSFSEDEESLASSEVTEGTTREAPMPHEKRRQLSRKSTRYALALPAPQLRTKQRRLVQIRPRLLLQLQIIGDKRAVPAFNLIPSQVVAGTLIIPKLSKRFPRMFHANAQLSQNDVLLVHSEDYSTSSSSSTSSEFESGSDSRGANVCAVISAMPHDPDNAAEIILPDGVLWRGSSMENGSYEFTRTNDDGETTIARWVRRSAVLTRNNISSLEPLFSTRSSFEGFSPDLRWTFSIIDPLTRRHPIMGSLTLEAVEVYDAYTTLSTSRGKLPPTRPFGPEFPGKDRNLSPARSGTGFRATAEVTAQQKTLMIATASWVRLHQQGWPASANPKFARLIPSYCQSTSTDPKCSTRRQAFTSYDGQGSRATSPLDPSSTSGGMHETYSSKRPQHQAREAGVMSTGEAFMKQRSNRMEELATVHGQEPLKEPSGIVYGSQSLDEGKAKGRLSSKFRRWTIKLLH